MKPDEIKLRVNTYVDNIIDKIFVKDSVFGKLKATTAKYWVKQNIWKLDTLLNNFVDQEGEIDVEEAINFYANDLFDEEGKFSINLHSMISNPSINQFIPNSIVVFTKNDLNKLFGIIEQHVEETTDCNID